MDKVVQKGGTVWIKWTCPGCGERVTATEANTFCAGGYTHETKENGEACGTFYNGNAWGFRAAFGLPP